MNREKFNEKEQNIEHTEREKCLKSNNYNNKKRIEVSGIWCSVDEKTSFICEIEKETR